MNVSNADVILQILYFIMFMLAVLKKKVMMFMKGPS